MVEEVTKSLSVFTKDIAIYDMDDEKEDSFRGVALLWDELPASTSENQEDVKASRASKTSLVKLVFNFLINESLFLEVSRRYYPTKRFSAIVENYFEEYRGEIYDALSGKKDTAGEFADNGKASENM